MTWLAWLLIAAGIFSICGAVFDWDWFMNSRKAQSLSNLITRTGARLFYIAIGLLVAAIGIMGALGYIDMNQ